MSEVLSISLEGMRADDIRRIRRVLDRGLRNVEIRRRYNEMRPIVGQLQALLALEEEQGLSISQLRRIIYSRC